MSFQIFSGGTTGNGSVFNQLAGPLRSLFNPSTPKNLVYPQDLASNPSMCHAVQFSCYDYTTGFSDDVSQLTGDNVMSTLKQLGEKASAAGTALQRGGLAGVLEVGKSITSSWEAWNSSSVETAFDSVSNKALQVTSAPYFRPRRKESELANISLFMPDSLITNTTSHYDSNSMTSTLGRVGLISSAISDLKGYKGDFKNILATDKGKNLFGAGTDVLGLGGTDLGSAMKNAMGVYTNPQIQLIYNGIELRTFSLDFIFTPTSPQEAKAAKDICDSFTFYSVPGLGSASLGDGQPGQYLTPPQLWTIKFVFLGSNGILGSVANIFSSALNRLGLGSLTTVDATNTIKSAPPAKVTTVQECVLESVQVDYAPNGWGTFNDGYPLQTVLSLTFRETQILTKDKVDNPAVASNFAEQQNRQSGQPFAGYGYDNLAAGYQAPNVEE